MAITIKNGSISHCGTAIRATGSNDIRVDGLSVANTKTVFDIDNQVNLIANNVTASNIEIFLKARNGIPDDLAKAIAEDIEANLTSGEIVDKYADRLQGFGVKLDSIITWSGRAVRGAELFSLIARLFS